jgi:DNA-binding MarR family transcriptional regulator
MAETKLVTGDNFITIQGWMVTDLKLKGNELIIYAAIYGFSQAANQAFKGSLQYLADWTNSTKQGVIKALKSLVEKGLIDKKESVINGVKFCEYAALQRNMVLNKVERGIKQSLPNNIADNIDYNNTPYNPPTASPTEDYSPAEELAGDTPHAEEVEPEPVSPKKGGRKKRGASDDGKKTYGEHGNVRLTDEELEKLRERYPDDYPGKIDALSRYIWQHHAERKYKDHYRTLLVWLKEDADRPKDRGGGGKTKPLEMSSFDTDEFYEAAVAKSYAGMGDET